MGGHRLVQTSGGTSARMVMGLGFFGVPVLFIAELSASGEDRLWMLEPRMMGLWSWSVLWAFDGGLRIEVLGWSERGCHACG